jgi:hypothetical protein
VPFSNFGPGPFEWVLWVGVRFLQENTKVQVEGPKARY